MRNLWAPWRWFNGAFDRATEREMRRQRSLVETGPEAGRRLFFRDLAVFVVGIAALMAAMWLPEPWRALAWPLLGWVVGAASSKHHAPAAAYKAGWLEGRLRFVQMAKQHDNPGEWIRTETEHDLVNVLGVDVVVEDKREDGGR